MRHSSLVRGIALTVACTMFSLTTSCVFLEIKPAPLPVEMRSALTYPGAVVIVHEGSNRYRLDGLDLDPTLFILKGTSVPVEPEYGFSETLPPEIQLKGGTVRRGQQYRVWHEVHLYLKAPAYAEGDQRLLTMQQIDRVMVYERNVVATLASYALGGVAIAAGTFAIIVAIILATKSSCPFVYVNNGKTFKFTGELFGGALFPYLERDDYLPLPELVPSASGLELMIANRLLERQYTDLAELVVVTHPHGTRALLDATGQAHVLHALVPPTAARTGAGSDRLASILTQDDDVYRFEDVAPGAEAIGQLELSFPRPAQGTEARLVLNARNSPWLDYAYGEVTKKFGQQYDAWQASQRAIPKDRPNHWNTEQSIPLRIEVQTTQGWKKVTQLEPVGPLASRALVVPIPLEDVAGNSVQIRLQTGFQFWEVDQVQLDATPQPPVQVSHLAARTATDERGTDVAELLRSSDGRYLEQPSLDMEALLTFPVTQAPEGFTQSYFLHARGYYEYIRDFTHAPERLELLALKRPGAFPRFSMALYQQLAEQFLPSEGLSQHSPTQGAPEGR